MQVTITPSILKGSYTPPPSKSLSHRGLIAAHLANGSLENLSQSEDIKATQNALDQMGHPLSRGPISIDCAESGSTLRFIIPLLALSSQPAQLTGRGRLMERPMSVYEDLGIYAHGQVFPFSKETTLEVDGSISSQFITGLLFAALLREQETQLVVHEPFESRSYVQLTLDVLEHFGAKIEVEGNTYLVQPQSLQPNHYRIPADDSQMAFFAVAAALQEHLFIQIEPESHQGDRVILSLLEQAGAQLNWQTDGVLIQHQPLHGLTIDLQDCPDLGPILCTLAAFIPGQTHITNASRLRIKESDRIAAMEMELRKWGVDIHSTDNDIYITGKTTYDQVSGPIDGHNDHRIVMAMTIFGLCAKCESIIVGAQAINKSYPTFFEDIRALGGQVVCE